MAVPYSSRGWLVQMGGALAGLALLGFAGLWPYPWAAWNGDEISRKVAFLALCAGAACVLCLRSPCQFWSAFQNLRWERVMHYAGLYLLGVWLSHPEEWRVVTVLVGVLCVTLAWGSAVVMNDVMDLQIDEVCNVRRPLVTGAWSREEYLRLGWVLGALSLTGAVLVSWSFAACVCGHLAIAFLYSNPPYRLRRFLGISTALIGVASMLVAVAGFISLGGREFSEFPANLAVFLCLGFTLGANLKDVKDFEGDRRAGVATLVTILGCRNGKMAVGVLIGVAMVTGPLLLGKPGLVAPAAVWAGLAWFLCVRQPFREKAVFLLYYTYLAFLACSGALRQVS